MSTQTQDTEDFVDDIEIVEDEDIEIVDDSTPDEEIEAAVRGDDDDELESYSERVQKRIHKEVSKAKGFKRQADEAARRESAAIEYARSIVAENEALKGRTLSTQESAIALTKASVASNLEGLQSALEKAIEEGDAKKQAELNIKINRAVIEQSQVEGVEKQVRAERERAKPKTEGDDTQPQRQSPQRQQISEEASNWFEKNTWFKVDQRGIPQNEESEAAHAYSEYLLKRGYSMEDPEFYKLVDKKMAEDFPDVVKPRQSQKTQKRPPTASTQRNSTSGATQNSKKTVLAKSEVDVALRMKPSWWGDSDEQNKKWLLKYANEKKKYSAQLGE